MNCKKLLIKETGQIAAGQLILCSTLAGLFTIVKKINIGVVLGIAMGAVLATANYFIMALCACAAANKAEQQDAKGGQMLIQLSYIGRLIGLFVILAVCAKSGFFNLITLVLPLAFTRQIVTIKELFHKKGGVIQ